MGAEPLKRFAHLSKDLQAAQQGAGGKGPKIPLPLVHGSPKARVKAAKAQTK